MVAIDKPVVRQEANSDVKKASLHFWKHIIKIGFLVLPLNLCKIEVSIAMFVHSEYRLSLPNLQATTCTTCDTYCNRKIPHLTSWDRP